MNVIIRNRVLFVLLFIGAAATFFGGFVGHAPNRLVSGEPIALWRAVDGMRLQTIAVVVILLLGVSFLPPGRRVQWSAVALAALLVLLLLAAAGEAAARFAATCNPVARTSLGAGAFISILCTGLVIADSLHRLRAHPAAQILVAVTMVAGIVAMATTGVFDALSIAREYQQRRVVFAAEFMRHCWLAASAIGAALVIGWPLGIALTRRPALEGPVFSTLNLIQTIPSLALFGLLIEPLSALGRGIPALGALGVSGIGTAPALIALVFYSLLPVVRNMHAGITGVDPAVIESARGMGMNAAQILWKVELPLAAPLLLAGLRIVTVQAIGLTVVAALIGAGGLGSFVFQGLGQYATDLVLLGALPVIALALGADFLLRGATALIARR